jgi:hypothetical protein
MVPSRTVEPSLYIPFTCLVPVRNDPTVTAGPAGPEAGRMEVHVDRARGGRWGSRLWKVPRTASAVAATSRELNREGRRDHAHLHTDCQVRAGRE